MPAHTDLAPRCLPPELPPGGRHRRALLAGVASTALVPLAACSGRPAGPWERMPLGTSADLRAVWFADAQDGWVTGGRFDVEGGLVGRTRDGGRTWRFASGIVPAGPRGLLVTGLRFFGRDRGVAITGGAGILATVDGGANWSRVAIEGGSDYMSDLAFLGESPAWAAGDQGVWRTDDPLGGWTRIARSDRRSRSGGRAVHFVDASTGWLAGRDGSLLRTMDGGAGWEPVTLPLPAQGRPTFHDVHFLDERRGWVVGDDGFMFATDDGGASWQARETGVPDARSATKLETVRGAGGKAQQVDAGDRTPGLSLSAIRFIDAANGWLAGFYPNHGRSLILRTRDGGASWRVEAEVEGEELRALQAEGGNVLWAVGARTREGTQSIYRRSLAAN